MYGGGHRVTVALDATENAYVQVGVHEMVHYVREMEQDAYAALEEVVSRYLDSDMDELVEQRKAEHAGVQELTDEAAREEIVAEVVPQVLTNEESARVLVEQNKTLAQKIRDFFIDFTRKLRSIGERYAARNDRGEALMFEGNTEALMEIADVLDKALMEAGRAEGRKNQGGKYSMQEAENGDQYNYDSLVAKPNIPIVDVDFVDKASIDEVIEIGRQNAEENASRHDQHGTPMVLVSDLGQYVSVGKKIARTRIGRQKIQRPSSDHHSNR